jgi:hypothetical protein
MPSPASHRRSPRSPFRRRPGRCRQQHRPGYALVIFAFLFFCLMALGALVIDLGLARLTQRQMQTAVDSAALEGLRGRDALGETGRREEARRFANLVFDKDGVLDGVNDADTRWQDLDAARADPAIDDRYIELLQDFAYDPASRSDMPNLETNTDNDPNGDMYAESDDRFQVTMRRTGEASFGGVSHIGPRIPYLFARGSLMPRERVGTQVERGQGIALRATAIAQERRAMSVGRLVTSPLRAGALPFVIEPTRWRSQFAPGIPVDVSVVDGRLEVASTSIGYVVDLLDDDVNFTNVGGAVSSGVAVSPETVLPKALEGISVTIYVPLLGFPSQSSDIDLTGRVIGFGIAQITITSSSDGTFKLTRLGPSSQMAAENASAVLTRPMPAEFSDQLDDPDLRELLRQHRQELSEVSDSLILAPALIR